MTPSNTERELELMKETIETIRRQLASRLSELTRSAANARFFFAPGRVNLIGEHVDYNGGHVFPCALDIGTYALTAPRSDRRFRMYSGNFPEHGAVEFSLDDLDYDPAHDWANYPKAMMKEYVKAGAHLAHGLEIVFFGNIPNGAGLSSSASIEVLTGTMLNAWFNTGFDPIKTALLGQAAENISIGVNCGIMDQFASAMGKANRAILLDCHSLRYRYAPLHLEGQALVIANSRKQRGLADSKYNERRAECQEALRLLQQRLPIASLGDLDLEQLEGNADLLPDQTLFRRARHAVSENRRTLAAVTALKENDLAEFGNLMRQSHLSLRDDYEVTGHELDSLVEAAWAHPGCIGARMTGAGFGGCTVNLVQANAVPDFIARVTEDYQRRTGLQAEFYEVLPGFGAREIVDGPGGIPSVKPSIEVLIESFLQKAIDLELVDPRDRVFLRNRYSMLLDQTLEGLDSPDEDLVREETLAGLAGRLFESFDERRIERLGGFRELVETRLIGELLPSPSVIEARFNERRARDGIKPALDWYYRFSRNTDYIKTAGIAKNKSWSGRTVYGDLEITINLSKPEKDPLEIARAKKTPETHFPKCLLCFENEGFSGNGNNRPARHNHRMIRLTLDKGQEFFFQYSPYLYYTEHSIVIHPRHRDMVINEQALVHFFAFVDQVPHYLIGSNSDIPIVGGSILSHDHYQAGSHRFPIEKAETRTAYSVPGLPGLRINHLHWPLSTLQLLGTRSEITEMWGRIVPAWYSHAHSDIGILPRSDSGARQNAVTPILRKLGSDRYSLYLLLRNNRTSREHPEGIFHPHRDLHHLKKENIGLIEAMGLAILPGRLDAEFAELENLLLLNDRDQALARLKDAPQLLKHETWLVELYDKYPRFSRDGIEGIIQAETADKFRRILEDAGVFKNDPAGEAGMAEFARSCGLVPLGW